MNKFYKTAAAVMVAVACIFIVACEQSGKESVVLPETQKAESREDEKTAEGETVCVYVCGNVEKGGIYYLDKDARVYDVIEKAGGMIDEFSSVRINMAAHIKDGQQIVIPYSDEEEEGDEADDGGLVNINTAQEDELMTLPGIGQSKAQSIIKFREENGAFENIEDIMQISGIKEAAFDKISDLICV